MVSYIHINFHLSFSNSNDNFFKLMLLSKINLNECVIYILQYYYNDKILFRFIFFELVIKVLL